METEIFYEGWMVKSPPQKRSVHGYPLIKKKWRRRWFVLEPGKFPGQYMLCYYTDDQKKRLKGTICLDDCDQIDTGLKDENGKYDFMFNIRTPKRVYYLAVDTENEMKTWAKMLCQACGFRSASGEEGNAQPAVPYPPSSTALTTRTRATTAEASTAPTDSRPTDISSPYIHISDCYTGGRPPPSFHARSSSHSGTNDVDEDDDNVFEDSSPPSHPAPRPPPWSVIDEVMVSSLKLSPPDRPPKPAHLANNPVSTTGRTGSGNYANSSDMMEVYRSESNNNGRIPDSIWSSTPNVTPAISRDLKPGRKVQGSVTMAPRSHVSDIPNASNFSTMGPPVERGQKPRNGGLSTTLPRPTPSSSTIMSLPPPKPLTSSRELSSSPEDWLNTDDVKFKGNQSDDEQIYFYMPPINSFQGLPLMIPAMSFEHPSISYIELDLPNTDVTLTAASSSKEVEDESKTIYKVIDKEKTEAFKKTKEDRESQRHAND